MEPPGTGFAAVNATSGDVGWAELVRPPLSNHVGQARQVSPGGKARYLRDRTAGLTWRGHWSKLQGRKGLEAMATVVGQCRGGVGDRKDGTPTRKRRQTACWRHDNEPHRVSGEIDQESD